MITLASQPPTPPSHLVSLAALSRNTSVISNSSSNSSSSSVQAPVRPRPLRVFTSPQARNRSPASPTTSKPSPSGNTPYPSDVAGKTLSATSNPALSGTGRQRANSTALTPQDFILGHVLGEGSYSTVVSAQHISSGNLYAVKILDKRHILKEKKQKYVHSERAILAKLGAAGHPGVVRLHWTFHDEASLYFVLDLAKNGELFSKINTLGSFSMPCTRYYAAQIVDAVCWMHSQGILHRDIKPENILLDDRMRIMITDFGTAKILQSETQEQRTRSFVGTPHYASPELLMDDITCQASDIWAVGCIIYQLIAGYTPFKAATIYLIMENIKKLAYSFPEGFEDDAKDLVQKILVPEPNNRLGSGEGGTEALMRHPFFSSIEWSTLWDITAPPLEPGLYKKMSPLPPDHPEDIGLMWDDLAGSEDEMEELGDADDHVEEQEEGTDSSDSVVVTEDSDDERVEMQTPKFNARVAVITTSEAPQRGSTSSGSGSSTEGSQHSKGLPEAVEEAVHSARSREQLPLGGDLMQVSKGVVNEYQSVEISKTQSLVLPSPLLSLLHSSETPLFFSHVLSKTSRRLLPHRQRPRFLLLTSQHRLLCVKAGILVKGRVPIKAELFLRPNDPLFSGNSAGVLRVEQNGEKGFIVHTRLKSYTYITADKALAARWVKEIHDILSDKTTNLRT